MRSRVMCLVMWVCVCVYVCMYVCMYVYVDKNRLFGVLPLENLLLV